MAYLLVLQWAAAAAELGADPDHIECVHRWADEMQRWRDQHAEVVPHAPMDPTYQAACRRDREAQ